MNGAVLAPVLTALAIWWSSTGVLFWLIGRDRRTFAWTASGATALMLTGMVVLLWLRDRTGVGDAYLGFAAGIALWAWHEALFLLGYIAGPRREPCPAGLRTWPRFIVSAQAVIHHELAIAAHALIIVLLSWGAGNGFAALTFLLLWGMRLNAKFVVFLGAPNISEAFVPDHLTYLSTYFGKRRVTLFFPLFITTATAAATALAYTAFLFPVGSFEAVGFTLLATLAVLAVAEHWALVLPIPDSVLWAWARRRPDPNKTQDTTLTSWRA